MVITATLEKKKRIGKGKGKKDCLLNEHKVTSKTHYAKYEEKTGFSTLSHLRHLKVSPVK